MISRFRLFAWTTGLSLALTGCGSSDGGTGNSQAAAGPSAASTASGWKVSSETDAMTDEGVQRASAVLKGQTIDVETQIACAGQRITYTLSSFDKEGRAAAMVPTYGRLTMMLRIDEQPAIRLFHPPRLANRFEFVDDEGRLPAASMLTLRLFTANGEETVRLDQSASPLRPMLNQCAQSIQERQNKEQAAREQRAAEQYARCGDHPCPIEAPPPEPDTPLADGRPNGAPPPGTMEVNLDQLAACQAQHEGRGTVGARFDCAAILARHDRVEEEIARRDFELESEQNRRDR